MPASKALETLLVCTFFAQSALSSGMNDDSICNKVVKKFFSLGNLRTYNCIESRDGHIQCNSQSGSNALIS
jgi:hypothetical protein